MQVRYMYCCAARLTELNRCDGVEQPAHSEVRPQGGAHQGCLFTAAQLAWAT